MKKQLVETLVPFAESIKKIWERPRGEYGSADIWIVQELVPLSDTIALIVYLKNNSKEYTVVFAYWIAKGEGEWIYFIPTYDHVYGMQNKYMVEVFNLTEKHNFKLKLADVEMKGTM